MKRTYVRETDKTYSYVDGSALSAVMSQYQLKKIMRPYANKSLV